MKLRTIENLVDFLDEEMAWRKKELSSLKDDVEKTNIKLRATAIRSGIVMLYAHWEGFIKKSAEGYLNFIFYQRHSIKDLAINFVALCLRQKINEFQQSNKSYLHNQLIEYLFYNQHERAIFNYSNTIITGANLNSNRLFELMAALGMDFTPYETKANLIDEQLLKYRNEIAHGKYLGINDRDYLTLHNEVTKMIEYFKTDIVNAVILQKYKRQNLSSIHRTF